MEATIKNRKFDIEFYPASQGFRMSVMELVSEEWQTLSGYNYTQFLLATEFDALCALSSDLFDEAVYGEGFAQQLGVSFMTYDDSTCSVCGEFSHYEEMMPDGQFGYVHEDCYKKSIA